MIKILVSLILIVVLKPSIAFGQDDEYVYQRDMEKANKSPRIEIDYQLILSTSMAKILKKHAPNFKIWPAKHFHPAVFTDAEYGYRFRDRTDKVSLRIHQCPSVVIGDFNGDNKEDIVMDGYDKTHKLRIFLLSNNNDYTIIISTRNQYSKLPENFNPYKPKMSPHDIALVEKGKTIKSEFEEKSLELKTDAIKETGETWGHILYYNHKENNFSSYTIGD